MTEKTLFEKACEAYNLIDDIKVHTLARPMFTEPCYLTKDGKFTATGEEWQIAKDIWYKHQHKHQQHLMKMLHQLDKIMNDVTDTLGTAYVTNTPIEN
jgi:hypothetical protein